MSLQPLLYVPHVYPGEVMLAYLLRLSEENGYTNPANILRYAGLQGRHGAGIPAPKALQEVFGWSENQLEMASQQLLALNGRKPKHKLLGYELSCQYVQVWRPKICPTCIRERGYHLPEWHMTHVVACPKHQCMLITHCPACKKALGWFRPGLLVCDCDAALDDMPSTAAPEYVCRIADLLVRKIFDQELQTSPAEKAGYPIDALSEVHLPDLLRLIYQLGRGYSRVTSKASRVCAAESIVAQLKTADKVFRDWPNGWYEYLDEVRPSDAGYRKDSTGLTQRYNSIYNKLFDTKYRGKGTEFMYRAFIDYALGQKDFCVDKRLLRNVEVNAGNDSWLGNYQCARLLGIDHRAIPRLARLGVIRIKRVKHGRRTKTLYCIGDTLIDTSAQRAMEEREAAAYMGMPFRVLKVLRQRNIYKENVVRRDSRGYQRDALDQLKSELVAGLPMIAKETVNQDTETTVSTVLRHKRGNENLKADFLIAVLHRGFSSLRAINQEPYDIVISNADVDSFFRDKRMDYSGGRTLQQTAELIGGDYVSVIALIKLKLLVAGETSGSWIVDAQSLHEFNARYVWTGEVANELRTTSKPIVRLAHALGLKVITVARLRANTNCHFIVREEIEQLKESLVRKGKQWAIQTKSMIGNACHTGQ